MINKVLELLKERLLIVFISFHCMNYGQRQAQLSVAIAAALRRLAYVFGGQDGTSSAAHMEEWGLVERSRCVLGV